MPAGTFVASSYAYLTARDLARVGLLMARDGRWGDRQLLPKDWVAFNREPFARYQANQDDAVPGGHWWLNRAVDGAATTLARCARRHLRRAGSLGAGDVRDSQRKPGDRALRR